MLTVLCRVYHFKYWQFAVSEGFWKGSIFAPSTSSNNSLPSATLGHSWTNIYCSLAPLAYDRMAPSNPLWPFQRANQWPLGQILGALWSTLAKILSKLIFNLQKKISDYPDFSVYIVFPRRTITAQLSESTIRVIIPTA